MDLFLYVFSHVYFMFIHSYPISNYVQTFNHLWISARNFCASIMGSVVYLMNLSVNIPVLSNSIIYIYSTLRCL